MGEIGLYVHIPFCRSRCSYCDFTSTTGREAVIPAYQTALLCELYHELGEGKKENVRTVFFGGGTPTVCGTETLSKILASVNRLGLLAKDAEVTVEANPGTVDRVKLAELREAGFNRLSLGVQTSHDRELRLLGRSHLRDEAEAAFLAARDGGFDNINLDFIFGIPGQRLEDWEETLRWGVDLEPEHLSCYGLQLEEGTPMEEAVAMGKLVLPSEDETVTMMEFTREFLPNYGLLPYEISNYAQPGRECRHNLRYWRAGDYIGIGAGAYSTKAMLRWSNTDDLTMYIETVAKSGTPSREIEQLTTEQKLTEGIMLGLRMTTGLDWDDLCLRWGEALQRVEAARIRLMDEGWLSMDGNRLRLTERAIPVSNAVIGRLCADLLG